jgi:hypothetical protein
MDVEIGCFFCYAWPMQQSETSKFYKGNPHPYDESLPSFAAINVRETIGEDKTPKLFCEFITVAPIPTRDEETGAYRWRLLVEQVNILREDTAEGMFPRIKKLAEERARIAFTMAAQPTRDTMVFSAGQGFRLNFEISEDQFLQSVARCTFEDPSLIDGMIERSQCESFRNLIATLKQS